MATDLIRRLSVHEICAHRTRALELYEQAYDLTLEANRLHQAACYGKTQQMAYGMERKALEDKKRHMDGLAQKLDEDIWSGVIEGFQFLSLMDKEEREKFEKSLKGYHCPETREYIRPPECTVENITATLERLYGESDMIFRRGLVNAFKRLCRDFKSNDGFKIGDRIVITYGCSFRTMGSFWLNERTADELRDIDRVMHVLDGKPAPDYQQGLCSAIREAMFADRQNGQTIETPYWKVRYFKNGNIHLWPLRKDLHDRANKIIAEWYGETLGAGHEAKKKAGPVVPDPMQQADRFTAADRDFYETPESLVERVIEAADLEPEHLVLEPSAGEGALAVAANKRTHHVRAIEIHPGRAECLRAKGFIVLEGDFLERSPEPIYHRVIMNPPFSKQQDILHVLHAWNFVKPGGRLVAIMAAGVQYRQDRNAAALRVLVSRYGGTIERLPDGSFEDSGTMVATVLVTIDKPL